MSSKRSIVLAALASTLLALVFFGPTDNWLWDPSFYYAQLRSPLIDGDLDFRNETMPHNAVAQNTVTGLQPTVWPVGPALMWAPFFLVAHGITLATQPAAATGYTPLYIALVSAGSALYGLLGVAVTYRLCRLWAERGLALVVAGTVLLATPLLYYAFRQPIMAHSTNFFAAATLILVCALVDRGRIPLNHSGVLIGVLVGLNVILRWTSVVLVLIPACLFGIYLLRAVQQRSRATIKQLGLQLGVMGLTALVVVAPQLALWHQLYAQWLLLPRHSVRKGSVANNLINMFFHSNRGLLWWSPLIVIGLVGLAKLERGPLKAGLLLYLATFILIVGIWENWHGGGAFGTRYFIETLPVVAIGVVVLVRRAWRSRLGRVLVSTAAVVLVLHQLMLMTVVEHVWVPLHEYLDGEPLNLRFQVDNALKLVQQPAAFFSVRPNVRADRQTVFVSLLAHVAPSSTYFIPLVGTLVLGVGVLLGGLLLESLTMRKVKVITSLLIVYAVVWFGVLLLL